MKTKIVPSSWTDLNDRRLDCGPYMSGAIESRVSLERLPVQKQALYQVTQGGLAGIYNGPRFARVYVEDPIYGVPFLGSTDILLADLTDLPLLAKSQVRAKPELTIRPNWTLITCSGTIGRMAYSRADMDGMAGSQHFMRVIPDPDRILPGYLFSYLNSRFGVPLVIFGTYGAIIQHIEPHHIADLPVPRLGTVEELSHELCVEAAKLRTQASHKLSIARHLTNEAFNFPWKLALSHRNFSITNAASNLLQSRMEATYHDAVAQGSDALLDNVPITSTIAELGVELGESGRLKQIFVDEQYGVPFITSSEIFRLRYEPARFLSRRLLTSESGWTVHVGDLLLARSGQVGGIIGRGVWADERFAGSYVSVDVMRLRVVNQAIRAGYLYAYLFLTDVGYRQLVRTAAGSSIPHLSPAEISPLRVPRTDDGTELQIASLVEEAGRLRAEAQQKEDLARAMVETAIEEGA